MEVFKNVAINQYHEIKEGQSTVNVKHPEVSHKLPGGWHLEQNYPNPFNAKTKISFHLMKNINVKLQVFDITGREVNTLFNKYSEAGIFQMNWDGTDQSGQMVPGGIYFCRIQTNEFSKTIKMILAN